MNQEEIDNLVSRKKFSHECDEPEEVIETHISWVFICNEFAYKIKKPVQFDFVDFSTLDKRKFYCEREIELNRRLAEDIYLEVVPVTLLSGEFTMDAEGRTKDYAVKMKKLDPGRRMDLVLQAQQAEVKHIHAIADQLADFHRDADVQHFSVQINLKQDFDDMLEKARLLEQELGSESIEEINKRVEQAHSYIDGNTDLFNSRDQNGFIRDCHGDLHAQNIFLLEEPVIFDCIEFNEKLRQIDILNELAFLCMDLDAYGYTRLGEVFLEYYNQLFPVAGSEPEKNLFLFYKAYRANVRAKIFALNALNADGELQKEDALKRFQKYIELLHQYLVRL